MYFQDSETFLNKNEPVTTQMHAGNPQIITRPNIGRKERQRVSVGFNGLGCTITVCQSSTQSIPETRVLNKKLKL